MSLKHAMLPGGICIDRLTMTEAVPSPQRVRGSGAPSEAGNLEFEARIRDFWLESETRGRKAMFDRDHGSSRGSKVIFEPEKLDFSLESDLASFQRDVRGSNLG